MSNPTYPAELAITPLAKPPSATVTVPGSKSITNRALVLAALASRETECALTGALRSEDTEVMVDCLRKLGFVVVPDWTSNRITIGRNESGRIIPAQSAELFVANSGTTMRFLTAMVSLGEGRFRLDGIARMRERPIRDLLDVLHQLRVAAACETRGSCPPVRIDTRGWPHGVTQMLTIRSGTSSQFLSGLLMAAAFAPIDSWIKVSDGLVSEPYVNMTMSMLLEWGRSIIWYESNEFEVQQDMLERSLTTYCIEPDASAASYFWAAAAITGGRVTVNGLTRKSIQGDVRFVDLLGEMGCRLEECDEGITVHGGPLRGIDVDMNAISDTVMTLAAVACFAEGKTTIRNVAHIRHKETSVDHLTRI